MVIIFDAASYSRETKSNNKVARNEAIFGTIGGKCLSQIGFETIPTLHEVLLGFHGNETGPNEK